MLPILPENVINKIMMFMSSPTAKLINFAIDNQTDAVVEKPLFIKYRDFGFRMCQMGISIRECIHQQRYDGPATRDYKLAMTLGFKLCLWDEMADNDYDEEYGDFLIDELIEADEVIVDLVMCKTI